ncbi:uncharacterized protein LOC143458582 [Clavelina lepadiformis]|uniref:DnaJ homolog subfamily B member 9 n=1 Tax=Clavelina lepadiformis TaxID=159417 RepID=A0ABP0FQK2_CLALP
MINLAIVRSCCDGGLSQVLILRSHHTLRSLKKGGTLLTNELPSIIGFIFTKTFATYYEILGIPRDAAADIIKQSYIEKCKKYHPDKLGADNNADFIEIKEAYEVLKSSVARTKYDTYLKSGESTTYDFHEWREYNQPQARRDYHNFQSGHHQGHMGVDAEWSDFLTPYNLLCFSVIAGVVTYIIWNEMRHAKSFNTKPFMPRYHTRQTGYLDISQNTRHKASSHDRRAETEAVTKPSFKLKKSKKNDDVDVFQKIKLKGNVSDKDLEKLKVKFPRKASSMNTDNLKTWSDS